MKKLFKKYLIEILILIGAWIILDPINYEDCTGDWGLKDILCNEGFIVSWEKIGIFIIVIAGVLILNRILKKRI